MLAEVNAVFVVELTDLQLNLNFKNASAFLERKIFFLKKNTVMDNPENLLSGVFTGTVLSEESSSSES